MTGKSSSKKSSQTTQAHLNTPVRHSALYFHCHTISQSESGPSWKLVSYGSIPYSQFSHGKCRKRRNNCKPTIQYKTEQFLPPPWSLLNLIHVVESFYVSLNKTKNNTRQKPFGLHVAGACAGLRFESGELVKSPALNKWGWVKSLGKILPLGRESVA